MCINFFYKHTQKQGVSSLRCFTMLRLNVCLVYFYFQSFGNWLFENFTINKKKKKKKAFRKVVLKSAILICHFKWEYKSSIPFFIFHFIFHQS